MSSEPKRPEEEQSPSPAETSKPPIKSNTGIGRYLAILFAAAFLLLLLAYFMQQRTNQETLGSLKESITSIESLNDLVKENQALHEEIDALEDAYELLENDVSKLEQAYQEAQASADTAQVELVNWSVFWEAEELYCAEDYEACAEVVRSWGASNFYTTPDAASNRAKEIFDHLVSLELITSDDLVWQMFQ